MLREGASVYRCYNHKTDRPVKDRDGLFDVVHMHGNKPASGLAEIEAVSVPPGFETEDSIRAALGEPEYELRMVTWSMLDYGAQGVRFATHPPVLIGGLGALFGNRVRALGLHVHHVHNHSRADSRQDKSHRDPEARTPGTPDGKHRAKKPP